MKALDHETRRRLLQQTRSAAGEVYASSSTAMPLAATAPGTAHVVMRAARELLRMKPAS